MNRAVRLAAVHRLGCITEDRLTASLEHLARCLAHWGDSVGDPCELQPDEIGSAIELAESRGRVRSDVGGVGKATKHFRDDPIRHKSASKPRDGVKQ